MEGVLERLGPMLPATCARRRLHTTTPGPSRARGSAAADGRLFTPGDAAVLASGGDPDHDSPVEGLLQQNTAAGAQVIHRYQSLISQRGQAKLGCKADVCTRYEWH